MCQRKNISILLITMGSGGAEKFVSLILPKLIEEYNVHLVLFRDLIHFEVPKEVSIEILNKNEREGFLNKITLFPKLIYKYNQFLKKNDIDFSISLLTRPNIINSLTRIFNDSTKTIISERCYPSIAFRSNKFRYYLYKLLIPVVYNKSDYLFSNSIEINNDLQKNFGVKIPVSVIYNPVLPTPKKDQQLEIKNSVFTIINVGSLYYIKNQSLLIRAFEKLKFNKELYLVGDGIDKVQLKNSVHKRGLRSKVRFTGKVKNVNDYLLNSDCFVLTSISEGFPNVLIEAMAVGLPVISTNCKSGPLEILNENIEVEIKMGEFNLAKYGLLINVGDEPALIKAINFLYNNNQVKIEYGNLAYKRSKDYDVEQIYSQLKKLLC